MAPVFAPGAALFLPFVLPICFYIVWTDLRFMRIPNLAVIALLAVFVLLGPLVLDLPAYGWRFVNVIVVLAVGFVLNQFGGFGAGDAKFAAAMAAFVPAADASFVIYLFAGVLFAAFATHRLARRVPALRRATPGWISWDRRDFPMGLALGPTLVFYLVASALLGSA